MDWTSFLPVLMLSAPVLCACLVFLAPVVANALARREGQPVTHAAGWTALLGPGSALASAVALLGALRSGEVLSLALGLRGGEPVPVVLTRADLVAILAVASAGGALVGLLLWAGATRPWLYAVALLIQGGIALLLTARALWPLATGIGAVAAVVAALGAWSLGRQRATG